MVTKNYKIEFEEENHIYYLNGEQAKLSITQLLAKHKLTPSYKDVDKDILKAAAKRGTLYHKDLEEVIKNKNYIPMTEQGQNYKEWFDKNVDSGVSEVMIGINYKGLILCGTIDDMLILKNGEYTLDDHKFNREFHRQAVTYQTSLALFMLKYASLNGYMINGRDYTGFVNGDVKLNCDFFETGQTNFERISLNKISDEEIIRLLECELKGEIYEPKEIELTIGNYTVDDLTRKEIELAEYELKIKALKDEITSIRNSVKDTLETNRVEKWSSPKGVVKYTYVKQSSYVRLDTQKLKNEAPELYSSLILKYPSQITRGASVRVDIDLEKYNKLKEIDNELETLKELKE